MFKNNVSVKGFKVIFARGQLENSCEPECTSCESGDGGGHAVASVCSITVEIAGSSFG